MIGATSADTRAIMVEGESGILETSSKDFMPEYQPSKRRIIWPNGAQAFLYNAESPERLRGPQHDGAWCDELASWKYDQQTWDNLRMTMRLGDDPRYLITTTPKPRKLLKKILKMTGTVITGGSTYDNAGNLPALFLQDLRTEYEGTRVGRQELHAEVLDDVPGALWTLDTLAANRVTEHPPLDRVVVAIDPAVTSEEDSDETGIMVGGICANGHGYLLYDGSLRDTPRGWAQRAVDLFHRFEADRIVAEVNNGGDMVELTIRTIDPDVPYKKVHASRGKKTRAEPISSLDERGMIHHVGLFPKLEEQMTSWDPETTEKSPDRVDARVWLFTELMLKEQREYMVA